MVFSAGSYACLKVSFGIPVVYAIRIQGESLKALGEIMSAMVFQGDQGLNQHHI